MQPSPAEIARTLASGLLPGEAHVRQHRGRLRVRHATTPEGETFVLTRAGGTLERALRPARGETDTALVLAVDDVVPVQGGPDHGRVWLSGWAERLDGADARAAADGYARVTPTGDLLGVGTSHTLYRFTVDEVRLDRGGILVEIDAEDFRAAAPDPIQVVERELLADLNEHHLGELAEILARRVPGPATFRAVRLDRYGVVLEASTVDVPVRISLPEPARDAAHLTELLHPALCPNCAGHPASR